MMKAFLGDNKSKLRRIIRSKRLALNPQKKHDYSKSIQKKLAHHSFFQNAEHILIYVSNPEEVDTDELIQNHLKEKMIYVPQIESKTNEIVPIHLTDWSSLKPGVFGILEIQKGRKKPAPLQKMNLIIVPGIAFDTNGHRIGYGKGYYDRLLKKAKSIPTIGLAYELQMFEGIPLDPHDQPVDVIITEKNIYNTHP